MNWLEGNLFSFNEFHDEGIVLDFIKMFQIGEFALKPGGQIYEHKQYCNEITYITSGKGFIYTNDKAMQVCRGDIHIISKNNTHKIIASPYEMLRYICLGFDFIEFGEKFQEVCEFYETSMEGIMSSEGDIRYLFDMLINEFYINCETKDCAVESMVKLILIKVFRCFQKKPSEFIRDNGKEGGNTTVYKITRYIDSNIYNVKSVREVAAALNFTENYISHTFKVNMGISLLAYIKKKKVEAAKGLIESRSMSFEEISELLKFDSVQSLSRAFKQEYGKTPTQYLAEQNKTN